MANHQNANPVASAEEDKTVFVLRMVWVGEQLCQLVIKHTSCFFESNTMASGIALCLSGDPNEANMAHLIII